jgi:glycolate oxidase iron-sulfur subunit
MDSPRGRIYLMKSVVQGSEKLTDTMVEHFDRCLGCMGCMTACPSGVQYDALIEQTRAEVEHRHKRALFDRLFRGMIFSFFPYPKRLRFLLFFQLLYVWSGLRWLVRRLGLLRIAPPRLANLEALMPPVTKHHLVASLAAVTPAQGPRRARVALLPGCVQRTYFPNVNEATIRVLTAEGCEVLVPSDLGCCGALSVHAGREEEAKRFARSAIEVLEQLDVDAIVVNAAGCGSSMKEWNRLLADDPNFRDRAVGMAKKVKDVTEFISEIGARATRYPLLMRVAYHDPCHLAHAQKIKAQPRALLRAIPGLVIEEIPEGDQCCGSAGIYNMVQPASAREVGLRKVENVLSTGTEFLVSANPGCTLQIQMLLREQGKSLRTAHPIEVLDASIRGLGKAGAPDTK